MVFPPELLRDFFSAMEPQIAGDVHTDAVTRAIYATDASIYQIQPIGVLIPRHEDDVHAAVEQAGRFKIPILPRGGGSSLAGQAVGAALVIDFSKYLDALLEVNVEEGWARVQPGIVLDQLDAALKPLGVKLGPDPASSSRATIGGMVANNASGSHSILYGNMVNHTRAARAFLADGTLVDFGPLDQDEWRLRRIRSGLEGNVYRYLDNVLKEASDVIERDTPKHWRRSNGYRIEHLINGEKRNLTQLLCGSEGTLAVLSEITVALVPRPKRTALGILHFNTLEESLRAVTAVLETQPSAVELFDGFAIDQARKAPGFSHRLTFIDGRPGAVLITEYYGESQLELADKLARLQETMERTRQGYAIVPLMTPLEIENVWAVRKEGLGLISGVQGDYKPVAFIEDASVPVEHLADYIRELEPLLKGTKTVMYAHASAGCLHVRPFINMKDAQELEKMREIALASTELVKKYNGAISSEHGDGLVRSWLLESLVGQDLYNVYRQIKEIFDPSNLFNPGKVVDAPSMTENLRYGPEYSSISIEEELDFSETGGFARAVELCNGNGACRNLLSGSMCPSFMVTREEEHSTRGRANALRAAMSGVLPVDSFTSRRMYEVMELCVQCKACTTECPSNVDMTKIKTEWLSKYWEENGRPFRTKLFAHIPQYTRKIAGRLARPVNWFNRQAFVKNALARVLKISNKRTLPPFAAEPFTMWYKKQRWSSDGPSVVLFADTFNNYNHVEVSRAAAEFLRRIGYKVFVSDGKACCGRTLLSKGLINEAQVQALKTVEVLYEYAREGVPIIGLEPSCILMLRDEYLSLLPGDIRTQQVAEVTMTFEEFVAHLARTDALDHVLWTEERRKILVHGHCHQKSIVGMQPAERCLSLPPNYSVETIDSGCCGMAGSFGYEEEHYDISIAMAERSLAPTIRAAPEDTIIVAAGTSCRAQIMDTTGRHALHPAEVMLQALEE